MDKTRPTLDEVRAWPATVPVEDAAAALGMSRAWAYQQIGAGTFPARVLLLGRRRVVVVTASLLAILDVAATST